MADPVPEVTHEASPRPASDALAPRRATADEVLLRPATAHDLPAIADIYNDAVRHSVATFDVEPQPPELFADRVASARPGDHVLVAEEGGRVVGMAYAATYRPRPAYGGTRETSVYVAPDARGRGLGRALYDELLRRVDADGIHVCLAVIAQPNAASEALHAAVGFERVGTLREVGRKFDRWVDTAWWQRVRQ
jgi:phosphinothricin acetyltransferase